MFPSVAFRPSAFFSSTLDWPQWRCWSPRVRSPTVGRSGSRVAAGFAQCLAGAAFAESITAKEHLLNGQLTRRVATGDYHHPRLIIYIFRPAGLASCLAGILPGAAGGNDGPAGPEEAAHCDRGTGRNLFFQWPDWGSGRKERQR